MHLCFCLGISACSPICFHKCRYLLSQAHTYLDPVVLSYLIEGVPLAKVKISLKSRKRATTAHFIWWAKIQTSLKSRNGATFAPFLWWFLTSCFMQQKCFFLTFSGCSTVSSLFTTEGAKEDWSHTPAWQDGNTNSHIFHNFKIFLFNIANETVTV